MTYQEDDDSLQDVISLSRSLGEPHRDLVILAEGNTSVRVPGGMLVKASGSYLKDAAEEDFVDLDFHPIEELLEHGRDDDDVTSAFEQARRWGSKRPSVESLLHAVCYRYHEVGAVAHTHPTAINSLLCSVEAETIARASLFPDQIVVLGLAPLFIEYVDPGLVLAKLAAERLDEHVRRHGLPKVIYLQNHGMFALGRDANEALRITEMAVKSARVLLGALAAGGVNPLSEDDSLRIHTRSDEKYRRDLLDNN